MRLVLPEIEIGVFGLERQAVRDRPFDASTKCPADPGVTLAPRPASASAVREPPELKARTINRVRNFLKAHLPATAAR